MHHPPTVTDISGSHAAMVQREQVSPEQIHCHSSLGALRYPFRMHGVAWAHSLAHNVPTVWIEMVREEDRRSFTAVWIVLKK